MYTDDSSCEMMDVIAVIAPINAHRSPLFDASWLGLEELSTHPLKDYENQSKQKSCWRLTPTYCHALAADNAAERRTKKKDHQREKKYSHLI